MKIALAQLNPTVADFEGNAAKILEYARKAAAAGADLAVFPEMCVLGYPPRDLVEKPSLVRANLRAAAGVAAKAPLPLLVGMVGAAPLAAGAGVRNTAALLQGGEARAAAHKRLLPTYDVFDEARYFVPGEPSPLLDVCGRKLGVTICEDAWAPVEKRHAADPVADVCALGAEAVLNLSASPFTAGKRQVRLDLFGGHACRHARPVLMCNQVGGNDELVFDGGSMAFDASGNLVAEAPLFEEALLVVDLDALGPPVQPAEWPVVESVWRALVLGTRDYLHKCGFRQAVLGLSGGVDSAVVACLAAESLGPENVLGVALPSRFSSDHSLRDAEQLAANLGIEYAVVPIEPAHAAYLEMLAPLFQGLLPDLAEENLQARVRGAVLMALSNKFGKLLLATGNKSELAVGYSTLYGDMCGGLAPINDVPKTMVYELARLMNREREVIPASTIEKAPSAELRPDQTDQDTLPPYEELDRVLHAYVEEGKDAEEMAAAGFDPDLVARTVRMIEASEFKRRQAAPGLKVTSKAFGYGRRIPVAKRLSAK